MLKDQSKVARDSTNTIEETDATWQSPRFGELLDPGAVRLLLQERIVHAFRMQLAGHGLGPSDADLKLFALVARAEQRLARVDGRAIRGSEKRDATGRVTLEVASATPERLISIRRAQHGVAL